MISTPSRWSSSCWTTRAASSQLELEFGAGDVLPASVTSTGRSTGTRTGPSERQPSSSVASSSERGTITGLTTAISSSSSETW